nr:hypothetical protein [Shewanella mangrovi]
MRRAIEKVTRPYFTADHSAGDHAASTFDAERAIQRHTKRLHLMVDTIFRQGLQMLF